MSFKANFYEAIVWLALEKTSNDEVVYEPSCSNHNCHIFCKKNGKCEKINEYGEVLYTLPDFLVCSKQPNYYHVCYWNSKETSHAKFWRTISELFDLKRHVVNAKSICVVFETTYKKGKFFCPDWYEDHLAVFKEIFDGCVFFNEDNLANELENVENKLNGKGGTKVIYNYLKGINYSSRVLKSLIKHINKPIAPMLEMQSKKLQLWKLENEQCQTRPFVDFGKISISPLRNASLQIVLISLLDNRNCSINDLLERLSKARDRVDDNELEFLDFLQKLPISNRDNSYSFIIKSLEDDISGDFSCVFSEDLEWFLWSWSEKCLPSDRQSIISALEKTRARFASSSQVIESINCIQKYCADNNIGFDINDGEKLWNDFLSVEANYEYNMVAELIISSCGLGTYPLVKAINDQNPSLRASRNDIRALYSNRKAKRKIDRQKKFFLAIVDLIPSNINFDEVRTAFLLRKCNRIVGPQSAINPLEILLFEKLKAYKFKKNVVFNSSSIELPTLASDLSNSNQAGIWRVAMAFKCDSKIIPLFFSAMKSPADCGHKTREFSGHLCLARYRNEPKKISVSKVSVGIAVLEGAYSKEDRRQFNLSGYEVCDVDSLTDTLLKLDLIESDKFLEKNIPISEIDLPLAAESTEPIKLNKKE